MQIFLDANKYLDYFREDSPESLTPLSELLKLVKEKKVKLLLPEQIKKEYYRNRESVAEQMRRILVNQEKGLSFDKESLKLPNVIDKSDDKLKEVEEKTEDLVTSYKELTKSYNKFLKKYGENVENETTTADLLLGKLFGLSKHIKNTDKAIKLAKRRYWLGDPPRKRKSDFSLGDAIAWELLLNFNKDNLTIISRDSDFSIKSKNKNKIHPFLKSEWEEKSEKKIELFTGLGEFINDFSGKNIIDKEIVKKEKFIPLVKHNPIRNIWNGFGIANELDAVSEIGFGGEKKYCPYCGVRIKSNLEVSERGGFVYDTLDVEPVLSSSFNYCPKCRKSLNF